MSTTAVTPSRRTHVIFDEPQVAVTEPAFGFTRSLSQIAPAGLGPGNSAEIIQLATGCYALKPLQHEPQAISERTDTYDAIQKATQWTLATYMGSLLRWRNPSADLAGTTPDAAVQDRGDEFLVHQPPASADFTQSLSADVAAYGQPTLPTQNFPMDRKGVLNNPVDADQGFLWRFEVPGTKLHAPDWIATLYFGGAALTDGSGQFALTVGGGGNCYLSEQINGAWTVVDTWRYCETHRVCNGSHSIFIHPHRSPNGGGYITFQSSTTEQATPTAPGLFQIYAPGATQPLTHVVYVAPATGRSEVTGPGPLRFDHRQDLRPRQQFSILVYPELGTLVDMPFFVPFVSDDTALFTLSWQGVFPDGTSIEGKLLDTTSLVELTVVDTGDTYKTYAPISGQNGYFATFTLNASSDRKRTPYLWNYSVTRDAVWQTATTTAVEAGATRELSITGTDADPSHASASLRIADPTNALSLLRNRAKMPVRIETEYDNTGTRSVLHQGYVMRANARRRGTAGRAYPSPAWHDYDVECAGMWGRLSETLNSALLTLANDPAAGTDSTGAKLPYKVTDIIRSLLKQAGFTDAQIDVPDSEIRFWPTPRDGQDTLLIRPFTEIAPWIVKTARNYLGWTLHWDGNAGAAGMWRLQKPTLPPYTNLAAFTTSPPGGAKLAHSLNSYSADGSLGFIVRGTMQTYVKPPEGNAVFVSGTGVVPAPSFRGQLQLCRSLVNTDALTNPDSPDYTNGNLALIAIVDTTLTTQFAVDFVARRTYDIGCKAVKMMQFIAPLLLITDPSDTLQRVPRPLRYYDPVLVYDQAVEGQWLVRSCNPTYKKDGVQMAHYELQAPRGLMMQGVV